MPKASNFFNLWLKPHHLPPAGIEATISRVDIEELHPRPGVTEKTIVLSFKKASRKLILNSSRANALVDIAGDELDGWPGIVIRLKPDTARGKPTILILPAQGPATDSDVSLTDEPENFDTGMAGGMES